MSVARLLIPLLLLGSSTRSWSQAVPDLPDRYRGDVAGNRARPAYDPLGVRLGSFIARADGDIDIGYNSNLFGRASQVVGDGYLKLGPALWLTSDWGRHALELSAAADLTRFFSLGSQNTDEYRAHAGGRLEIGDRLTILPNLDFAREAEPRGSSGNRLTIGEPLFQRQLSANIGVRYAGNLVSAELLLAFRRDRYEPVGINGAFFSQRMRDSNGTGGRATLLYKVLPAMSVLVQGVADEISNPHKEFCCMRDAHGYAVLGGVRFDPSGLIAGQIAIGVRRRFFEGTGTSSHGFTYDARVQWYPTELLTVELRADQQFRNSGISDANAVLVNRQTLGITWEMYRNLNIFLQAGREGDHYRQVRASTELKSISLRATYTSRRALQLSAFAIYQASASNRPSLATRYDALRTGVSVRLRI